EIPSLWFPLAPKLSHYLENAKARLLISRRATTILQCSTLCVYGNHEDQSRVRAPGGRSCRGAKADVSAGGSILFVSADHHRDLHRHLFVVRVRYLRPAQPSRLSKRDPGRWWN